MGTEVIIPGTPLSQWPAADRSLLTLVNQNGFSGPGNIASPGAGAVVAVERYSLKGSAPTDSTLGASPAYLGPASLSVSVPTGSVLTALPFGGYEYSLYDFYLFVALAAVGSGGTGVFARIGATPGGASASSVQIDGQPPVRFTGLRSTDIQVFNSTTLAQTVQAVAVTNRAAIGGAQGVWSWTMPFRLGSQDVLRLRNLNVRLGIGADSKQLTIQQARLAYALGQTSSTGPFAVAATPGIPVPCDFTNPVGPISGFGAPYLPVSAAGPLVVYGYDLNPQGESYAPTLQLSLLWGGLDSFAADGLTPYLDAQIDVYRNAASNG